MFQRNRELAVHGADWSELMSELHGSLGRAEEELRLIHMDPKHKHEALGHLIVARSIVSQLERWCHE